MAFDGFVTKKIITELSNVLIGAKINKIFEPNKNEVILGLYNSGKNYNLLLSTHPELCRICLTNYSKPNPQNAYNFCMLLRKYLTGAKITSITSFDLERTVKIDFECYNELNDLTSRSLYIEVMSRQSNIILTNNQNFIIDTLKHTENTQRELLPAHEYIMAPITKKSFLDVNSLEEFKMTYNSYNSNTEDDVTLTTFFCTNYIGFSKTFVNETLRHLAIDDKDFSNSDLDRLYKYLKDIINNLNTDSVILKTLPTGKDYTIYIDNNSEYGYDNDDNKELAANIYIDDYYFAKEANMVFTNSRNSLLKIVSASLKKVYKKIANIDEKLKECDNMDNYRLYGELLTANLYRLSNMENTNQITLENYYDNNNLIKIPLDPSMNIQKNIEKYFKKYNKLKNALTIVSSQKLEAVRELDYIESIVFSLSNAKTMHDINEVYQEITENVVTKNEFEKKKKLSQKRKERANATTSIDSINYNGYTIYLGKNNIQNDYLSMRFANANDIWFHAQKIHGSHVLLRNPDNLDLSEIPEEVIFKCATLAKENSKAYGALNVSIDYCFAKFVKKPSGSKPGMVIYNNFKTIIVK